MDPQRKGALMQYTTAAKSIIFDANRMREFLPMMDTKSGAIQAVQAVVSVIEQKKPVPPDIAPLLAVNVYMLMVDMAREITDMEPDPEIVKGVVSEILSTMAQSHGQGQPEQPEQPEQPGQPGQMAPEQMAQQPPQGGGIMQKAMA